MVEIKTASLLLLLALMLPPAAQSDALPFRQCHIESRPANKIYAVLETDYKPPADFTAGEWIIYAPYPPSLPSQTDIATTLGVTGHQLITAKPVYESSAEQRLVQQLRVPAGSEFIRQLPVKAEFWATLRSRRLAEGAPTKSVPLLSAAEREMYIAKTDSLDFDSPQMQRWILEKRLERRGGEKDIDFAFRAFETIRGNYNYLWATDLKRKNSEVCTQDANDCGGLSYLLVGTLRANKIPARVLIGRWAESSETIEDRSNSGKCHVKSEFYADNVGWVPVEMSRAVSHKEKPALNYFGRDSGKFLTMVADPDLLLDSVGFGVKPVRSMQDFRYWVVGNGKLGKLDRQVKWQVTTQRLDSK